MYAIQFSYHSKVIDLEFDLSSSIKGECEDAIGLPIYRFLLMFYSKMGVTNLLYKIYR